jgi:hypothetical protein
MADFNAKAYAASVDRRFQDADLRIAAIEKYLLDFDAYQKKKQHGLGDDTREADVLRRGLQTFDRELASIKAKHAELISDHHDLRAAVSGIGEGGRFLESGMKQVVTRLRELAYHVGVYDEVVQGVWIRPGRAVPAIKPNMANGSWEVNPVKVCTKTFSLAATPRGKVTIPPLGTAQVSFVIPAEQNLEGDMEIYFLELASAQNTSFRVRLNHTGLGGKYLMNQPVHALAVFGNMNAGPQPFEMYETIFLEPNMELVVEFFDFSGLGNQVEVIAHGRKFVGYTIAGMDRRGLINAFARNTWPYWLTTDQPVTLTAGLEPDGTGVPTEYSMTLERQINAELGKAMRFGSINGVAAPVFYHIQMTEGQSGNLILDTVPVHTVAGNSNFPFPFPEPYLALRGTLLTGNMYNDSGLPNLTTDFVMHGRALPLNMAGQRTLEPLLDGRAVELPPASNRDLTLPRGVSM